VCRRHYFPYVHTIHGHDVDELIDIAWRVCRCSGDAATVSKNPEIPDEAMMGMIQMANHKPIANHSNCTAKISQQL
jgi:hypothetical protein